MALTQGQIDSGRNLLSHILEDLREITDAPKNIIRGLNSQRVYSSFVNQTDFGAKIDNSFSNIDNLASGDLKYAVEEYERTILDYLNRQEALNAGEDYTPSQNNDQSSDSGSYTSSSASEQGNGNEMYTEPSETLSGNDNPNVKVSTRADGRQDIAEFNPDGSYKKVTTKNPDGSLAMEIEYDEHGNAAKIIKNNNGIISESVMKDGQKTESIITNTMDGSKTTTHFDENGNVSKVELIGSTGKQEVKEYNANGSLAKRYYEDDNGVTNSLTYDQGGRVTEQIINYPGGGQTVYKNGSLYSRTDIRGNKMLYDKNGNAYSGVSFTQDGGKIVFENGRITSEDVMMNGNLKTKTYQYDGNGNVTYSDIRSSNGDVIMRGSDGKTYY